MKKAQVLIVTSEFPPLPGGIGNHAYNLATHLANNHFEVALIADQRSDDREYERNFDKTLNFKVHRVSLTKRRWFMYFKRLQLLFRNIKNSEIVIASGKFPLWAVAFCSLFYKRKYVAVIHGSEVNFSNPVLRYSINKALKRFSTVIAVSHFTKSLVSQKLQRHIVVIPNGFDASKWNAHANSSLNLKGQPSLITVGNVTERKGQLNVIKLLPELIKISPELHYHCVGLPTEAEVFLKVARDLKVATHVTFHGKVDDADLQQLLLSSDVFVMLSSATSTGDVEGFGIAILEANALGIPAIGAIGCGIEDAIHDNKSGLLIHHQDAPAFALALQQILEHKTEFSKEAKAWSGLHDWNLIIERYVAVIEE